MTRLADTQLNCCKLSLGDPIQPVSELAISEPEGVRNELRRSL